MASQNLIAVLGIHITAHTITQFHDLDHLLLHHLCDLGLRLRLCLLYHLYSYNFVWFGSSLNSICVTWKIHFQLLTMAANGQQNFLLVSDPSHAHDQMEQKKLCRDQIVYTIRRCCVRELINGQRQKHTHKRKKYRNVNRVQAKLSKRTWRRASCAEHRVLLPIRWHWERIVISSSFYFLCSTFFFSLLLFLLVFLFSYSLLCLVPATRNEKKREREKHFSVCRAKSWVCARSRTHRQFFISGE